ncbi:MAG: hypothetical protein A3E87_04880 [Gammaproteobacteria bacterium RIFCSPHIGHO2_12_FULL_35_23]|nr:MAG: hypothetical protein A3E87_04880 [Gammaproteobacteria bacterium RIFCSPHIGHO2_12_FULL_35_23]
MTNKALVDHYPNEILRFLMLAAVCVKHPIIVGNIAEHTLPMLNNRDLLSLYIKERYGNGLLFKDTSKEKGDDIIVQSVGIKQKKDDVFILDIAKENIVDQLAFKFIKEVLLYPKISLLSLFVDGYADEAKVKLYYDYFEGDTNKAISRLITNYNEADAIVSDLDETLLKQQGYPKSTADINLLNQLWQKTVNPRDIVNSYWRIILFVLNKHSVEEVIEKASLGLLEAYIDNILAAFKIKNKDSKYDINDFVSIKGSANNNGSQVERFALHGLKFNGKVIDDFTQETIKELLCQWVSRVECDFDNKFNSLVQDENSLISIFYRYIQWANTINTDDKRENLARHVLKYLKNQEIDLDKKLELTNLIFRDCAKIGDLTEANNSITNLFNKNVKLVNVLEEVAKASSKDISCYEDFKKSIR